MDNRYENPTIAMIYRTWRNRQNMVRAEGKLVLQIKAICRGFADGEIKEAAVAKQVTKVWNGVGWVTVKEDHPDYNPGKQPQG